MTDSEHDAPSTAPLYPTPSEPEPTPDPTEGADGATNDAAAENEAAIAGAGAPPAARAVWTEPASPAGPTISEQAVHIEDRSSRFFVIGVVATFVLIFAYGVLGGPNGLITKAIPAPSASASAPASPSAAPSASASAGPSASASATPGETPVPTPNPSFKFPKPTASPAASAAPSAVPSAAPSSAPSPSPSPS
ncbi:MAG: hypothetical protein ACYDCI_12550 [Candidatus Limnocylindrales bacterium]